MRFKVLIAALGATAISASSNAESPKWSSDDAAAMWATYVLSDRCTFRSHNPTINLAMEFEKRGVDLEDFRGGKYFQKVLRVMENFDGWLEGQGFKKGCDGIEQALRARWPETLLSLPYPPIPPKKPAPPGELTRTLTTEEIKELLDKRQPTKRYPVSGALSGSLKYPDPAPSWSAKATESGAALTYGFAGGKNAILTIMCKSGVSTVDMISGFGVEGIGKSNITDIVIKSGSERYKIPGATFFDSSAGRIEVIAQVNNSDISKIIKNRSSEVEITVLDRNTKLQKTGIEGAFDEFRRRCPATAMVEPDNSSMDAPIQGTVLRDIGSDASNSSSVRLEICNRTSKTMWVFFAHPTTEKSTDWIVKGWFEFPGSSCKLMNFPKGLIHYFAETKTKRWGGEEEYYCVPQKAFEKKVFKKEKCTAGERKIGVREVYVGSDFSLSITP